MKASLGSGLHYAEDTTFIYAAGHNVVKFSVESKLQEFLNGSEASVAISCIAVAPSRRCV